MKRYTISTALILFIGIAVSGQVFNTSATLKPGRFNLGIEPSVYVGGATDFNLFLHGGVGIVHGIDFAMKLGLMGDQVYVGGDVEFSLTKRISFAAGAHNYNDFGLDFTGLFTFPLGSSASIFGGLDADLNFPGDNIDVPLWIPLGLEIPMKKNILFIFETEINVTNHNRHFIGGGVNFLFG